MTNIVDLKVPNDLPIRSREYRSPTTDSTKWNHFEPREDDIIVTTSPKSGTTWMQQIVAGLVFQGEEPPALIPELSIWVDCPPIPEEEIMARIKQQKHRRFLKTHLPIDGIPFYSQCKYIYVGRDGRDVFMSLFNHYNNFNDLAFKFLNNTPDQVGEPLPLCPNEPREFWQDWISKGSFEWEKEGYPFQSPFYHVQSWWNYRHLPNILFVHFANLKKDLPGEIRRIADFLNIKIEPNKFDIIVEKCTFEYMKKNAEILAPRKGAAWKGGATTFINKGTNGRWKDVLTAEDIEQYQAVVADRLSPDCAHWFETGELPSIA
jgi:aryl sulfotransferase